MLTWILIAIVIAALFGVINLNEIGQKSLQKAKKLQPHLKAWYQKAAHKIESGKTKVENRISSKDTNSSKK